MPSADQFTPAFVGAFIARCYERGLTKEATTHLLTLSATAAAHENQGFSTGFRLRMLEAGMEKSAWAMAGKLMAGGLAAAGIGGAGLYGYNKARDAIRAYRRTPWSDVPVIGGYDAGSAADYEAAKLEAASRGVLDLNRKVGDIGRRRHELQSVYDSRGPGSAQALAELQRLRREPFTAQRNAYQQQLDSYGQDVGRRIGFVEQDLNELNASRNSWWGKLRNHVGFPRDYDAEERMLAGQRDRLAEQQRLAGTLSQRLRSGTTAVATHPPLQDDLQQRFFPTEPR